MSFSSDVADATRERPLPILAARYEDLCASCSPADGCRPIWRGHAVREGQERVERLTQALRNQTEHWRLKPLVAALSSLRGIDFVAAVTLAAEISDFSRFAHPTELMGFLGLVPSEYSTGDTRRQGNITKLATAMRGAC